MQVAGAFSCHRNTISNIVDLFETLTKEEQLRLLSPHASFTQETLLASYGSLLNKSRKPHAHKQQANSDQEAQIGKLFTDEKLKVGATRLFHILKRRYLGHEEEDSAGVCSLTHAQLRGIYKRKALIPERARSVNGEVRHLYDYKALGCFERLHYDVKYVRDQHALPESIYRLFSRRDIPKYEWNIIDVKSRTRFLAYSYERPAEFGLLFLVFVILYIRAALIAYERALRVGVDNGMEFCGGSKRKEEEWNLLLSVLQAAAYSYEPRFDIRKNLIERSHLTDDEELYIPRGRYMGTKALFLKEATDYQYYWNFERPHSGIGMNNRTPYEVLTRSGLAGAQKLLQFPVLMLEDAIAGLRDCLKIIEFEAYAKQHPELIQKSVTCQKTRRNIEDQFALPFNAQNVLTYYRRDKLTF